PFERTRVVQTSGTTSYAGQSCDAATSRPVFAAERRRIPLFPVARPLYDGRERPVPVTGGGSLFARTRHTLPRFGPPASNSQGVARMPRALPSLVLKASLLAVAVAGTAQGQDGFQVAPDA